ncbi:hypothetical protein BpHYR1_040955 [Brachionus plicatilis]|uniref:Uncharacterized protein n=1 Tax=Brachionus plicatilis TaxID=10195 RepID=A0A3M7T4A1_BRAPC|nr:hypothetical protein BpHYR1_040955 [Brachionus plicatilis]
MSKLHPTEETLKNFNSDKGQHTEEIKYPKPGEVLALFCTTFGSILLGQVRILFSRRFLAFQSPSQTLALKFSKKSSIGRAFDPFAGFTSLFLFLIDD